jgi:hypothetical protein
VFCVIDRQGKAGCANERRESAATSPNTSALRSAERECRVSDPHAEGSHYATSLEAMQLEPKDTPETEARNRSPRLVQAVTSFQRFLQLPFCSRHDDIPRIVNASRLRLRASSVCPVLARSSKKAHATPFERLACYSKKTMNDGLNIHPDKRKIHSLHLWVEADFAGVWARRTLEILLDS